MFALYRSELKVLDAVLIALAEGKAVTLSGLAKILSRSPSTVCETLQRLQCKGYLRFQRSADGYRISVLLPDLGVVALPIACSYSMDAGFYRHQEIRDTLIVQGTSLDPKDFIAVEFDDDIPEIMVQRFDVIVFRDRRLPNAFDLVIVGDPNDTSDWHLCVYHGLTETAGRLITPETVSLNAVHSKLVESDRQRKARVRSNMLVVPIEHSLRNQGDYWSAGFAYLVGTAEKLVRDFQRSTPSFSSKAGSTA